MREGGENGELLVGRSPSWVTDRMGVLGVESMGQEGLVRRAHAMRRNADGYAGRTACGRLEGSVRWMKTGGHLCGYEGK